MATTPKIRYDIEAAVSGAGDVNALANQLEGLANTLEGDLKVQALASAQALRELGAKQGAIASFRELKTEVSSAATRLREAQSAAQTLGAQIGRMEAPTRAQAGQMEKLRDAVRAAKTELQTQTQALDNSRASLAAYGIASNNVATAERNVRTALAAARAEVQSLAPAYTAAGNAAAASGVKQTASAQAVKTGLKDVGAQLRNIQNIAATAIGGTFITSLGRDLANVADEYSNLAARIKLVTGEGEAFETAFAGVQQIALATNSELEATGTLFARISQAGKELGLSQAAALGLTQTINQAIQLSGGSAESAKASIVQLVQGLQSGVLRGEEFNSVMEQSPRLAQALAAGLGKTTGELRTMAQQGRLTTDVVLQALRSQSQAVAEEFAKLPPTVGRAIQNLSSAWTIYVGEADKGSGASAAAARAIDLVALNLETLIDVATRAGAVLVAAMGVQAVAALRAYIVQATAAGTATSLLGLQMSALPKTLQITVALVGFEAAYQFGDWLRENSQTAREFGVQFVNYIEKQVNSLRFLKEAATAVFSDDTIDAALERYNQRAAEQQTIIAQMMKDAEQAPSAIDAAANKAAASVEKIGDAAEDSSRKVRDISADIVEAFDAARISKLGDAQASEANLRVQLQLAQQSEQMALFMGNEYEARKAKILQMQIEIQLVEARAAVARVEAEGSIAVAQAKLAEMTASKEVNLVKQAELETAIKLARAKIAEADATGKSTELMRKQLEQFKNNAGSAQNYGRNLDDLSGKQRRLASDTRDATRALKEQADASGKYSSPLGDDKYAGPEGGSVTGNTREERLAGQNAVDNSLALKLAAKIQAGSFTAADNADALAVIAALDQNEAVNRDLDSMGGAFSTAGSADRAKWQQIRTQLAQQVNKAEVGRRVVLELKTGGQTDDINTDEEGARKIVNALQRAGLSAGR
jgi:tape measure domain-containing protein